MSKKQISEVTEMMTRLDSVVSRRFFFWNLYFSGTWERYPPSLTHIFQLGCFNHHLSVKVLGIHEHPGRFISHSYTKCSEQRAQLPGKKREIGCVGIVISQIFLKHIFLLRKILHPFLMCPFLFFKKRVAPKIPPNWLSLRIHTLP